MCFVLVRISANLHVFVIKLIEIIMESKVHRLRCYNPKPQPINCASINKSTNLLAVARGDASIEIWDVKYSPYVVKFIPGVENGSVEALCWVQERLLSTGLGGSLLEWDLEALALKTTTLLTGYAAWCLDVTPDNTQVAVGTEQGYINLFNVENDDIVYQKLFDKQEGRILCCKFNATGNVLATGSVNSIRVWNVKTGQATCRLSVSSRGEEVIVWCLAFLSDNTIISGDSLGRLSFWDSVIGDQLETYTTHKADITALAVTDDELNLYCSGVDPTFVHFVRVQGSLKKQSGNPSAEEMEVTKSVWAKDVQKHIHEHDVRVIITHGNQQISAGISGYLVFTSYPPLWTMRIPPMIMWPRTAVSASNKLLLLRYSTYLEIWKLGAYAIDESGKAITSADNNEDIVINKNTNQSKDQARELIDKDTSDDLYKHLIPKKKRTTVSLNITEKPTKLLQIYTKHKRQMRCCEISPSGEFIIYATDGHLRMLKMELESEEDEGDQHRIFLSKLSVHGLKSCDRIAFTEDSRTMVAHTPGTLHVFQVDPEVGATLVHTISTDKFFSTKSILHLHISHNTLSGVYLVVADTKCAISVWTLNGKKFEHYCNLPTYHCVPSALSVAGANAVLYVTYVDQKLVEYELTSKTFLEWPDHLLPKQWPTRTSAFQSVTKHPGRNAIVFQDLNSIWVIDKSNKTSTTPNTKLPSRIIPIKYLAGFHWLGPDEALSVEVPPGNIVSQLPAMVATKKH